MKHVSRAVQLIVLVVSTQYDILVPDLDDVASAGIVQVTGATSTQFDSNGVCRHRTTVTIVTMSKLKEQVPVQDEQCNISPARLLLATASRDTFSQTQLAQSH
jgi:hypothetical protein